MKKILSVALIATAVAGFVAPASAGKKKAPPSFTTVLTYTRPAPGSGGNGVGTEGLSLTSTSKHFYLTVEIADDASPTGNASISWDTDGDGVGDTAITVCGKTEGSVEVPANTTFTVYPWLLPSADCPTGFSTTGTITATFSAKP